MGPAASCMDDDLVDTQGACESTKAQQPGSGLFWREKVIDRHGVKQSIFNADRRHRQKVRQQRTDVQIQQALVEDKQRGQQFRGQVCESEANASRVLRSVRKRACRRCGVDFLPGTNASDACTWHRGQYVQVDSDGEMDSNGARKVVVSEKQIQQAIKANNRKKKSKQPNKLCAGFVFGSTEDIRCAWTCCGD